MPDSRGKLLVEGQPAPCYDGLCWLFLIRCPSITCSQSPRPVPAAGLFSRRRVAAATRRKGHTVHDCPRGPRQRSAPAHRVDAPRALDQRRGVADARVAARARGARRHRALRRAHALQGHGHPQRRGHRPGDRLDRRAAGCVHREGVRQLLHQGPRRAPAARPRRALGHRPAPGVRRRRHRAREEGDPRGDQDGRGHARRPRPRAVHPELLGRPRRWGGRSSARPRRWRR